jgi:uncharacterized membrane protein
MDRSAMRRYEAFGDGVFAIVITLLVLELRIPDAHGAHATLASRLLSIWPSYAAYLVSFLFLAFWWLVHHGLLDAVKVMDGPLIWMNFLYLMLTSLIPFAASLASENWGAPVTGVLYGLNLLAALAVSRAFYAHVVRTPGVQSGPPDPATVKTEKRAYGVAMSLLALGVALSFFSAPLGFAVYGLMALFYVVAIWKGRVGLAAATPEASE